MTRHARGSRRYRKSPERRVWVFSELNHELRPEVVARIITSAGLEQARLEAEAQADDAARTSAPAVDQKEASDA